MKKFIMLFLVFCVIIQSIGISVLASDTPVSVQLDGESGFNPIITAIMNKYSSENGYKVVQKTVDNGDGTYTYTLADLKLGGHLSTAGVTFSISGFGSQATPYSRAIVLSESTENNLVKPDEPAFTGVQGTTGFKNITIYQNNTQDKTSWGSTTGIGFYSTNGRSAKGLIVYGNNREDYSNINFITEPIKNGKIKYGYSITVNKLEYGYEAKDLAGGIGELKDSTINGEYITSHYTNDKVVRARLDSKVGFAIYNKNLTTDNKWDVLIKVDKEADSYLTNNTKEFDVEYILNLETKTFDVTVTYGENIVSRTNVPFCIDNYTQIDAIEFNSMSNHSNPTKCRTSQYLVDKLYIEEVQEVTDIIISEDSDLSDEEPIVLAEGQKLIINDGVTLKNAIVDATSGEVVSGATTLKGYVVFNEKGEIDAALNNGFVTLIEAEDGSEFTGNKYGFMLKQNISGIDSYNVNLYANGEYNGKTYNNANKLITFDNLTGIEGEVRFNVIVRGTPEGVEITVE